MAQYSMRPYHIISTHSALGRKNLKLMRRALGHLLVCLLVCSHHSLSLSFACFALLSRRFITFSTNCALSSPHRPRLFLIKLIISPLAHFVFVVLWRSASRYLTSQRPLFFFLLLLYNCHEISFLVRSLALLCFSCKKSCLALLFL